MILLSMKSIVFRNQGLFTDLLSVKWITVVLFLSFSNNTARAQNIQKLFYCFDYFADHNENVDTIFFDPGPDINLSFTINTSELSPGLHFLNLWSVDENYNYSQINHFPIYRESLSVTEITGAEYFFDADPGSGQGTPIQFAPGTMITDLTFSIDISGLQHGVHKLFIRSRDESGKWSMTNQITILYAPIQLTNIIEAEYFIDTDPGVGEGIPIPFVPGSNLPDILFSVNTESLSPGIHYLFIRAKDESGKWSHTNLFSFLCEHLSLPDIVKAEYFIDVDPGAGAGINIPLVPGTQINNLMFQFNLLPLSEGLHSLFIRAMDMQGKWSQTNRNDFTIVPLTRLDIKVFLQGPFAGGTMSNALNAAGYLPLSQPYNTSPWNYNGSENVTVIPDADVVDWVLVEIRETEGGPSTATADKMIARKAGFLMKNGDIIATDGNPYIWFSEPVSDNLYAVIWHRNHLNAMTADAMLQTGKVYSFDLSSGPEKAFGGALAQNQLSPGIWGLIAGDGNPNGHVNNVDKNDVWRLQADSTGYKSGDFNLNGQVNAEDKITVWAPNTGKSSQVPK
jgi:hypothetical protein